MIFKEIKGLSKKSKDFQRNQRIFKNSKEIKGFTKKSKDFPINQRISK